MTMSRRFLVVFVLFLSFFRLSAQLREDSIPLNIADAEQRFINKNLSLIINRFNVDIAKANYLQAKLWYNPNLYFGTTLYNTQTNKWLSDAYPQPGAATIYDQTFQLQQLLTLAGRHKATWKLAQEGVNLANLQVLDLLRNLKYELHTDISDLYYNQQLIKMYRNEEVQLKQLLDGTRELYQHGNAALNDVIQLEAQLQGAVAQELTSRQAALSDEQDLKILLVYPGTAYFKIEELPRISPAIPVYQTVIETAEKNRPDLLLAQETIQYNKLNVKLQRVTGFPDLTVGTVYQGAGGVTPAYVGIYGNMDLPVFNRNQWNIQGAKVGQTQAEYSDTLSLLTVRSQATNAYCNLISVDNKLKQIDSQYEKDLDQMLVNAVQNYLKRNINILTFLSLISTYNDGKTNLINLYVQYFNGVHNVNLNTGIELLK